MAVQHVLGGLDEGDAREFRAHLLQCGHCRARVGELRAIAHDLADVERAEERAQAANQLETKKHDEASERPLPAPRPSRTRNGQIAVIALLLVIIVLGVWNFFLRSTVADLEGQLDAALEASRTLEAGRAWDVEADAGIDVEVREDGESLAIVIAGIEDGVYRLQVTDGDDEVVEEQEAQPTDGRMFLLVQDLRPEAEGLRLLREGDEEAPPVVEAHAEP